MCHPSTTTENHVDSYRNKCCFGKVLGRTWRFFFNKKLFELIMQSLLKCWGTLYFFFKVCSSCSYWRQNPCSGRLGEGWAERPASVEQFAGEQGNAAWRWSFSHVCRSLWQTFAGMEMLFEFSFFFPPLLGSAGILLWRREYLGVKWGKFHHGFNGFFLCCLHMKKSSPC